MKKINTLINLLVPAILVVLTISQVLENIRNNNEDVSKVMQHTVCLIAGVGIICYRLYKLVKPKQY